MLSLLRLFLMLSSWSAFSLCDAGVGFRFSPDKTLSFVILNHKLICFDFIELQFLKVCFFDPAKKCFDFFDQNGYVLVVSTFFENKTFFSIIYSITLRFVSTTWLFMIISSLDNKNSTIIWSEICYQEKFFLVTGKLRTASSIS